MPKKKAKNVVITPQRKAKAKAKPGSSVAKSKKKGGSAANRMWNTADLDFDSEGRLIIMNQMLARALEQHLRGDASIVVIDLPPIRPPPPPPPVDYMCGCGGRLLKMMEEFDIHESAAPQLEHGQELIG